MPLILKFKKGKNKPSTLNCTRSDGSGTWTKLHPGIEDHDLAHFVVETELGYKNAFYGIINDGYEVSDFEPPKEKRPSALIPKNLHEEAIQTEYIVNLLQTEYWNSGNESDFLPNLKTILEEKSISFPVDLNEENLKTIRKKYHELVFQWKTLPPDSVLELEFIV